MTRIIQNNLRPWVLAFGMPAAMIVAIFLLQAEFLPMPSQTAPQNQEHALDQGRMSVLLSEMQQNITASGLNVIGLAPSSIAASPASITPIIPSFWQAMAQFPWAEAVKASDKKDQARLNGHFQQLLDTLVPYLIMPPPEETKDASCEPPTFLSEVDCSKYPTAFTGVQRQKPVKVVHMLQLGFDVDILEIQLNELDPVVDTIFIIESTRTHNKNLRKPLLWDHMKSEARFRRFAEKIVHIVVDDVDVLAGQQQSIWGLEHLQEKTRWEAFLAWNNRTGGLFGPDDLVGFGDTDEIPSSHNIHLLKHCEMAGPSIDIGSWFAWGKLDRAFRPDWPVPNSPWTLGDPTYWTLRSAMAFADVADGQYPSRMRGTSGHYLLGGIHMTDNSYLPFLLAKTISCTECGEEGKQILTALHDCFIEGACRGLNYEELMAKLLQIMDRSYHHIDRIVDVSKAKKRLGDAYYVPWYIECYPGRFPAWFGEMDERLATSIIIGSSRVAQE